MREPSAAVERVERALALAEESGDLGAFWELDGVGASRAAEELDAKASTYGRGPLHGLPLAVKDLFDVTGLPTTGGLPGSPPPATTDAEVVRRLRRAGAVPIGKTAMDPLGCTTGGQAPGFPPCLNPLDPALSPGGSSAGSAVAVAAGIVPLAIGTDTAGSVRIPAAYCGVVGLRPPSRSVPRRGMLAVFGDLDVPAVLGRDLAECVAALEVLSGGAQRLAPGGDGLRVGALSDLLSEADPAVASACERALARLPAARVELALVSLGWRGEGFGVILARRLAEIWGQRVERDPSRFPDVIHETVEFGRGVAGSRYREAVGGIGRARNRIRRRLGTFDAVVCPTVPVGVPAREAESVAESTRFTRIFSALGWPAISLPCGQDDKGRPCGLQVASPPSRFARMLAAAYELERAIGEGQ